MYLKFGHLCGFYPAQRGLAEVVELADTPS
jgi:hypothetical protein